jgi:hypothetical protein
MKGGKFFIMKADDLVKIIEFKNDEDEEGKEVTKKYTQFEFLSKKVEVLESIVNLCVRALADNNINIKEIVPTFENVDVLDRLENEVSLS